MALLSSYLKKIGKNSANKKVLAVAKEVMNLRMLHSMATTEEKLRALCLPLQNTKTPMKKNSLVLYATKIS